MHGNRIPPAPPHPSGTLLQMVSFWKATEKQALLPAPDQVPQLTLNPMELDLPQYQLRITLKNLLPLMKQFGTERAHQFRLIREIMKQESTVKNELRLVETAVHYIMNNQLL